VTALEACGARAYSEEQEEFHARQALISLEAAQPLAVAGEAIRELTLQLLGREN
jgi:hypothetical protein